MALVQGESAPDGTRIRPNWGWGVLDTARNLFISLKLKTVGDSLCKRKFKFTYLFSQNKTKWTALPPSLKIDICTMSDDTFYQQTVACGHKELVIVGLVM